MESSKNTVSRRSFLTGAAALSAGIVAAGLGGCAPKAASSKAVAASTTDSTNWYGSAADESSFKISREIETDVLICVPHERPARVRETHDLVLNCLCDGVDTQLLGEQEM